MNEDRKTLEQRAQMTDLERLRHSASHVLATAILKIWPEAQFAAGLGRKEDALREGRRAIELLPITQDALNGTELKRNLAIIYAWIGEKELALKELADALQLPGVFLRMASCGCIRIGIRCAGIRCRAAHPFCPD